MRLLPLIIAFSAAACAGIPRRSILVEEDSRRDRSALLRRGASHRESATRRLALRAMGRVQSREYARDLEKALGDRDPGVREEAAFALGQLGLGEPEWPVPRQESALRALSPLARSGEAGLRAKALEALGKAGPPEAEAVLAQGLGDSDPRIRGEAALALFRLRHLKRLARYAPATVAALVRMLGDPDAGVRWRAAFAFSRWPEPEAAAGLAAAAADSETWVRLFALRALGQLGEKAPAGALATALKDPDSLVRAEAARALGQARRAELIGSETFLDASSHVRAAAADALAGSGKPELAAKLDPLLSDASPLARGQAVLAAAALLKEAAGPIIDRERTSPDWWLRSRAFLAAADFPEADLWLIPGLSDRDPRVAAAALESLSKSSSTQAVSLVDAILREKDAPLEVLGTAVEAAGNWKLPELLEPLHLALRDSPWSGNAEIRDGIVKAIRGTLDAVPGDRHESLSALPAAYRAPAALGSQSGEAAVVLETQKGEIELALYGGEAPMHVATFLASVSSGAYDGTIWHRVVSNFVIQGGDPRGSGWGDGGLTLRDEINPRLFERGTLGMPKAGKDTGGVQLFITHVPAPHLDGRYTVFGRVSRGMDVVDRIEPGDKILRARVRVP